jgi:hypothetical protein
MNLTCYTVGSAEDKKTIEGLNFNGLLKRNFLRCSTE